LIALAVIPSSAARAAELSLTMDDFAVEDSLKLSARERNDAILGALERHGHLQAALFVTARNIASPHGRALLRQWEEQGQLLANHTYSHRNFNSSKTSLGAFEEDFTRADRLLKACKGFVPLFRFPYLQEGDTVRKRDGMRAFLKDHGYRVGFVTIDASDWYVSQRLEKRLRQNPKAELKGYRDFYLKHLWERAEYYDDLARKVLGREVKHTLLVHFNLLNALFLDDLLTMFEKRGWTWIDAGSAFKDPVYSSLPVTLPAGESLIWALAKETGRYDSVLRYPGEDGDYEKAEMDRLGL
jgi:hypothetical protein